MFQTIKSAVKSNKLLRALLIPLIDRSISFRIYKILNQSINIRLIHGAPVKIYPKGQIAFGIFTNQFEKEEIELFQKIIKPGMTVVDAGANIGLYSLIASQLVGPKGHVFSFEPSNETFMRLSENIKLNSFTNLTPINKGLGDIINQKLILRQDEGYDDAERYIFPNNTEPDIALENVNTIKSEEEIEIDTLDNCLESMNITKVDFMKIDTEGYEYYVLQGATEILKNNPEIIIFMECTALGTARASTSQEKVFDMLRGLGLNIFYWNSQQKKWSDEKMGLFNAGEVWVCKNINLLTQ